MYDGIFDRSGCGEGNGAVINVYGAEKNEA